MILTSQSFVAYNTCKGLFCARSDPVPVGQLHTKVPTCARFNLCPCWLTYLHSGRKKKMMTVNSHQHMYTHTHIYIYIYIYACLYVTVNYHYTTASEYIRDCIFLRLCVLLQLVLGSRRRKFRSQTSDNMDR